MDVVERYTEIAELVVDKETDNAYWYIVAAILVLAEVMQDKSLTDGWKQMRRNLWEEDSETQTIHDSPSGQIEYNPHRIKTTDPPPKEAT